MPRTRDGLRRLGPADLPEVVDVLADHPAANCFLDHRVRVTRLDRAWVGGDVWGYVEHDRLLAVCHVGANIVPSAGAPEPALAAFAERALTAGRASDAVFGPQHEVRVLWSGLAPRWAREVREYRWEQPLLGIATASALPPDPRVRRSTAADLPVLYPACVAMSTEEVGVSPEANGTGRLYYARVRQLVERGWSFILMEDGEIVFKAEVAAATPYACQIQGVWVRPDRRGEGMAAPAMAAVVRTALQDIAPLVTLYVNDFNVVARRVYERVGFTELGRFATVMF